jgi:hypothetical protein
MFSFIRHPIRSIQEIRYIASQLTPAHLEALAATKTDAGRDMVNEWITKEIFPELA